MDLGPFTARGTAGGAHGQPCCSERNQEDIPETWSMSWVLADGMRRKEAAYGKLGTRLDWRPHGLQGVGISQTVCRAELVSLKTQQSSCLDEEPGGSLGGSGQGVLRFFTMELSLPKPHRKSR